MHRRQKLRYVVLKKKLIPNNLNELKKHLKIFRKLKKGKDAKRAFI